MPSKAGFGNFRFTWAKLPSTMSSELDGYANRMDPALLGELQGIASDMESYGKTNRPWNDRTTDAKNKLSASAQMTAAHNVSVVMRHGVPYGGFLETGTSRMSAYPIIGPTLQAFYAPIRKVMDEMASLNF
jgi:hypothetical protein